MFEVGETAQLLHGNLVEIVKDLVFRSAKSPTFTVDFSAKHSAPKPITSAAHREIHCRPRIADWTRLAYSATFACRGVAMAADLFDVHSLRVIAFIFVLCADDDGTEPTETTLSLSSTPLTISSSLGACTLYIAATR